MALARKLVYALSIGSNSGLGNAGAETTWAHTSGVVAGTIARVAAITAGATVDTDLYGNQLAPNNFGISASVAPAGFQGATGRATRTKQQILASFVQAGTAGTSVTQVGRQILVDFIQYSTTTVVGDPAAYRAPRVRVRVNSLTSMAGRLTGFLYVQKQHSIEV